MACGSGKYGTLCDLVKMQYLPCVIYLAYVCTYLPYGISYVLNSAYVLTYLAGTYLARDVV